MPGHLGLPPPLGSPLPKERVGEAEGAECAPQTGAGGSGCVGAKLGAGVAKGSQRRPHKFLIPSWQLQLCPAQPGRAPGLRAGTQRAGGSGVSGEAPAELQAAAGLGQAVA